MPIFEVCVIERDIAHKSCTLEIRKTRKMAACKLNIRYKKSAGKECVALEACPSEVSLPSELRCVGVCNGEAADICLIVSRDGGVTERTVLR